MFILISCGRRVIEKSNFPANNASALESEVLDDALTQIQNDFNANGVSVDVRDTRYSVADTQDALGICYKDGDGKRSGIALHHKLFLEEIEDRDNFGILYKVLLHEIGHCFFNREHDETHYKAQGHIMLIEMEPGKMERYIDLSVTVMSQYGVYPVAKSLWPYYVKEIAGLDRIISWENILPYTDVKLVPLK